MVSSVALQQNCLGFDTQLEQGLSVWSLHIFPVGFPSRHIGFLPQFKDMQVDSELLVGVSVNGGLSLYVSPVMNWRLINGVENISVHIWARPVCDIWE